MDIRTIFLDLDDTLYPKSSGVWDAVGDRINSYISLRLGLPQEQIAVLRDAYYQAYGTTLSGLIHNHQIDPHEYLEFVHQVPIEDLLLPDPALARMLASLPQRLVVLTNSSAGHVRRVAQQLGVLDEIDQIIDVVALEFVNKPLPDAYRRALALAGEDDPRRALVADDSLRNLLTARDLQMTTVLVGGNHSPAPVDFHIARITDLIDAVPGLLGPGPDQGQPQA